MKGEKETTTVRIPSHIREELSKEAESIGISLNSYILTAIHAGRKHINATPSVSLHIQQ